MRKTIIFKIGIGIFIIMLLIFSSVIFTAGDTKTFGNDLLMKRLVNKIPVKINNEIPELEDFYPEDVPDLTDRYYLEFWFDKDCKEYILLGYIAGF